MVARFVWRAGSARLALTALVAGAALIAATGASAGPGTSTTMPFTFAGSNSCTGEMLSGTGTLHLLLSGNASDSGNVQSHLEANVSGLQAVTTFPTGGKKYVVIDQQDSTQTFASASHETVEQTFQLVRSGEFGTLLTGDDFYFHYLAHITANANGDITVQDINTDMRCK
jgi:hypothetical protein